MKNVKKLVVLFGTLMLFSPAFAQEEEEKQTEPNLARLDRFVGMQMVGSMVQAVALNQLTSEDLTPELLEDLKTSMVPSILNIIEFSKKVAQRAEDLRTTAAAEASAGQLKKLSAPEFDTLPDKDLYTK